jgi:hypothetical protein
MNHTPRALFSFLFIFFPLAQSRAQTTNFREVLNRLRSLNVQDRGYPSPEVPPDVQKLLPQMKAGLRKMISEVLNAYPAASVDVLRHLVLEELKSADVQPRNSVQFVENYDPEAGSFGYVYDVEIRQPAPGLKLLAIVTTLDVPCGSDSSLYVYELRGASWQLVLIDEASDYDTVADAQGSFQYAVSPPDKDGGWFVVAADVNPWCSSNWQSLRYKVMRVGQTPDHPQILFSERQSVFLGNDETFKLRVGRKGFQISQIADQSLDSGILTRVHIQKYEVAGNRVSRVPPLGLVPQDFLDEWVQLPWEEATHWVSSKNQDVLQVRHSLLGLEDRKFGTEFDYVQSCPAAGNLPSWQIGLLLEAWGDSEPPPDLPGELFFTIVRRDGAFYVADVVTDRPPGCPGEARPSDTLRWQKLP